MKFPSLFRFVTVSIRGLQFSSAVIVAALNGLLMHSFDADATDLARFAYTEALAAFTMVAVPILMLPSCRSVVVQTSADLLLSMMWWAVFGLMFHFLGFPGSWVFSSNRNMTQFDAQYEKLNTSTAFAFISAIFFLLSAVFDCFVDVRDGQRRGSKGSEESAKAQKEAKKTGAEVAV